MDLDPELRAYYLEADLRDYGTLHSDRHGPEGPAPSRGGAMTGAAPTQATSGVISEDCPGCGDGDLGECTGRAEA
jgi:hypothetical protein